MIILAHRAQDIPQYLDPKFGVEIDVRDHHGTIQVAHDPIIGASQTLQDWVKQHPDHPMYAVNVKADGFERQLSHIMDNRVGPHRWFAFDMSFPTTMRLNHWGAPLAIRVSDLETGIHHKGLNVVAAWADRWNWKEISHVIPKSYYDVPHYFVSPELHIQTPTKLAHEWWDRCRRDDDVVGICTDRYEQAWEYFNASMANDEEGG